MVRIRVGTGCRIGGALHARKKKEQMIRMAMSDAAQDYLKKLGAEEIASLEATDPEFAERWCTFAFDEVVNEDAAQLPDRERFLVLIATLMGCQGIDAFRGIVAGALNFGVTPVEVKEVVYQGTAYLGLGRTLPFVKAVNEVFAERGIELPLPGQATTTFETRLAAGNQVQIDYFGEGMRERWVGDTSGRSHINKWLADNCFGDWYTRNGLSDQDREMITFCFIAAQGGCEPQCTSHANGNMNLGNDKDFLYRVVSQMVPYIGYPRSLNALSCIDKAAAAREA